MAVYRRFAALILMSLAGLFFVFAGGNPSLFIDIPHLVFVVVVLIGATLLCFPVSQVLDAFSVALTHDDVPPISAEQRAKRIAVFSRMYQLSWGTGLTLCLFNIIAMLDSLAAPASIGIGMAVALTAPLYGAVLAEFVFNPLQQIAMNQPIDQDDDDGPVGRPSPLQPKAAPPVTGAPNQSGLWRGMAVIAILLAFLLLPIISFSEIKKEDAFAPEVEAIYLRYLYGDAAPEAQAVNPRLEASRAQRELEFSVVQARLQELMHDQNEVVIRDGVFAVLSSPQPEGVNPARSHLWRAHLAEEYARNFYNTHAGAN
ncbi:MAG: hypothetical protein AAGC44_14115 [Planctomycetota bacterium]